MNSGQPGEAATIYPLQPAIQHAFDRAQHQVDRAVKDRNGDGQSQSSTQLEVESVQPESGESKQIYFHFTFSAGGPPKNTLLCKTLKDCCH